MILSSHGPQTSSLPPAKSSWKTTTVDDVVRLIKLVEGRDPAWRFLEIRQIDEIRRNVERVVSASDRDAALHDKSSKFPSIREAISGSASGGSPLLASEMCVAQSARERLALWESGKAKKFEEAPLGLRVLMNARNRQGHRRLLDTPNSACAKLITDCVRIATSKEWLVDDTSGTPKISDTARSGVVGAFKASMVRPTGAEGLSKALKLSPTDFAKLGEEVLKMAQEDLAYLFGSRSGASQPMDRSSGVSTKAPIVEHALEVLQRRSGMRLTRQQIIQAATVGLNAAQDPSVRDTDLPIALTRQVADVCFPQDATDGQAKTAEFYLTALAPLLRDLPRGHEGMLRSMQSYAERSFADGKGHECRLPVLQREALSLAGHWLTRKDLSDETRDTLKKILLKGASPYAPRLSAEVALHWVVVNHESFPPKELERATLSILEHHDRAYLYHSLYISADSARREGRTESKGALEAVTALIKGGRFGVEEASQAYRAAGLYIVRREREPSNGLWATQRVETAALMREINEICGGEPERRCGDELARLEDMRRIHKNKSALTTRHRKERMLDIAGSFIARHSKQEGRPLPGKRGLGIE
jgi:hypothetical protein